MRFGGIFLAVALLLGACTGDPEPKEPTSTPTSPRPSSTATLPTMPDQAKEDSPEGAAAFVTHWIQVFNYAAATGDVEELSRHSSPECEGCQRYIDLLGETYEAGGYIRGGGWRAGDLQVDFGAGETYVDTTVAIAAGTSRPTSDSDEVTDPSMEAAVEFGIERVASGWVVTQLGLGDEE